MVLVEENGVPPSLVVDGANRYDSELLEPLLIRRIRPTKKLQHKQNLCLDAGFVGKEQVVKDNGFIPHIRPRGKEKKELKNNPKNFEPSVGLWKRSIHGLNAFEN